MTERCVVYCATKSFYPKLMPSARSLLKHNQIDRLYILAEDVNIPELDELFNYELSEEKASDLQMSYVDVSDKTKVNAACAWSVGSLHIINVQNQQWFPRTGPNFSSIYSYMVLVKMALCHILPPTVHKVLALDCDTIIEGDISGIWDTDLSDAYFAGVPEQHKTTGNTVYVNGGVILWNLDKMRDGKADELIRDLNRNFYMYKEQDAMNKLCQGHIALLDPRYNACDFSGKVHDPLIRHFASHRDWYEINPYVQPYKKRRDRYVGQ